MYLSDCGQRVLTNSYNHFQLITKLRNKTLQYLSIFGVHSGGNSPFLRSNMFLYLQ